MADGLDPQSGGRVFAPRPRAVRDAWIMLLGALVLLPILVLGALDDSDGSFENPVQAAIIFGSFAGLFTLLAVYVLISVRRMRVIVSPQGARVIRAFSERIVVFSGLTRGRWRALPAGGSLVLYGPAGRVVIEFASYQDGSELARLLRESIPAAIQEDYEHFEAMQRRPRPSPVIGDKALLRLSLGTVPVALAAWACAVVLPHPFSFTFVLLGVIFCASFACAAALDAIRRPGRRTLAALLLSLLSIAILTAALWPMVRIVLDDRALTRQAEVSLPAEPWYVREEENRTVP